MSRSNNNEMVNPATKFMQWSGAKGELTYYDKEKESKIEVKMPFTFLLLDALSTIKGYSQQDEVGFYSNEVKNVTVDQVIVKTFKGEVIAKGLYKDIKDTIVARGAKYAQSCYIAFHDENKKLVIGNISFMGSSLGGGENKKEGYEVGAWIGFCKSNRADLLKKAIVMEKDERICVNGATQFYCPKFKFKEVTEETNTRALELDKELQIYLSAYFERNKVEGVATPAAEPNNSAPSKSTETEMPHAPSPAEPFSITNPDEDGLPF